MSALRVDDLSSPSALARPQLRIVRPPMPPRAKGKAKKPPRPPRAMEHELDNAQDEITCQRREGCRRLTTGASCRVRVRWRVLDQERLEASTDPFDRAHNVRDVGGKLVPSATGAGPACCSRSRVTVEQSKPRRYPASVMTVAGVSIDSSFDDLYERQCRLDGVPGIGVQARPVTMKYTVAMMHSALNADGIRLRDVLRQRTRLKPEPGSRLAPG